MKLARKLRPFSVYLQIETKLLYLIQKTLRLNTI